MTIVRAPLRDRSWFTAGAALAAGIAWLVVSCAGLFAGPLVMIAVGVSPVVLWLILSRGWFRALAVIFGGMTVLGSGSDVGVNKIAYTALLCVCVVVAGWRLLTDPPPWARVFRPLIAPGVLFVIVLAVGALLSPLGTDPQTVVRQGLFYFLIVAAPIVAIDSARDFSERWVYAMIGLLGVVAAVGFAADWLSRRGVSALPFGRYVLSSLLFPAYAFALALTRMAVGVRPVAWLGWLIVAVTVPVAMLVTGTRTNLIVFATVLGIVGARRHGRTPPLALLGVLLAIVLVGIAVFPFVASASISDPNFLQERLQQLLAVVTGSADSDQSYVLRNQQYGTASAIVAQYPWFGLGVGWQQTFTLDTPLLTVVKIGIVGSVALVLFLTVLVITVVRSARLGRSTVAHTAFAGLIVVGLGNLPFGTPFEDRGFGFVLLLALLAVAIESRSNVDVQPPESSRLRTAATIAPKPNSASPPITSP